MKIALDAGHMSVGVDNGASDRSGTIQESAHTYELAKLIDISLRQYGHKVIWCRPATANSIKDSLQKRVKKANFDHADLFVSLHFNALNTKAYGSEVWIAKGASKMSYNVAKSVLEEINNNTDFINRGVKKGNFFVLRHTNMPAILIECCFIDNPSDMAKYDPAEMAIAIVNGIAGEAPASINLSDQATLKISKNSILKKSTEQASYLPPSEIKPIKAGEYKIQWLGTEENHYLIIIDNAEWFIFNQHCEVY